MAKKIYYCEDCYSTWGGEPGTVDFCPNCMKKGIRNVLIESSISQELWHEMSDQEKEEKRKEFKQDTKNKKEVELEKIKQLNDLYEYHVETIADNKDGYSNPKFLESKINEMAKCGWRLISVSTNEVGKISNSSGFGGFSAGTNATIEETVLFFERRIEKTK